MKNFNFYRKARNIVFEIMNQDPISTLGQHRTARVVEALREAYNAGIAHAIAKYELDKQEKNQLKELIQDAWEHMEACE